VAPALEVRQPAKGANNAALELEPGGLVGGRHLVHGLLGRGGMAAVYDVLDTVRGGRCALKSIVLPARVERRAAILTLFERELLTLAQLQHPNVVSAFDYGVHEGVPYYTMQLVPGAGLQSRVPLPWSPHARLRRDLCSVFSLLPSCRLIYRDLNPRNVRSTDDVSITLIDFGTKCPMGPTRQLVGTRLLDAFALEAKLLGASRCGPERAGRRSNGSQSRAASPNR
jgi:serine/threonine protein kinase